MFCVYLTCYFGGDLPPFYIGSTSIKNLANGYHGSVSSKEYSKKWKHALKTTPKKFSTIVLSNHDSRDAALLEEERIQRELDVIRSPLFLNMSYARGGFVRSGPLSEETKKKISSKLSGRKIPDETVAKVAIALTGKKRDPNIGKKISQSKTGVKLTDAHREKCGNGFRGRTHSEETKQKMRETHAQRKGISS